MTKSPNLISLSRWLVSVVGAAAIVVPFAVYAGPMEKNPVVENLQRPFDWTGFYVGGNAGGYLSKYDFESHEEFVDVEEQFFGPPAFDSDAGFFFFSNHHGDRDGAPMGGLQLGYNHQFGHFVFGVEGDFARTSTHAFQTRDGFQGLDEPLFFTDTGGNEFSATTFYRSRYEAETNWTASARARIGWAQGRFLVYATGGAAWAQMSFRTFDVANTNFFFEMQPPPPGPAAPAQVVTTPPPGPTQNSEFIFNQTNSLSSHNEDEWQLGWTAGGGIEVAFNDAVTLALEYRHNGFGDENFSTNAHGGPIFPLRHSDVDFDSDQVTVRMNILLNHFVGGGNYASASPATNNVAVKSPFGGKAENVAVGYTKAKDADKWSAKDNEVTPVVDEPFNWSGFYVGANVGGTWTDFDWGRYDTVVDLGAQANEFQPGRFQEGVDFVRFRNESGSFGNDQQRNHESSADSIIGGGQLGFQWQFGHFVAGVEGDFQGMNAEGHNQFTNETIFSGTDGFDTDTTVETERSVQVQWSGSARGKLGYARGPVLLYVTGGGVWASARAHAFDRAVTDFFEFTKGGISASPSGANGSFVASVSDNATTTDRQIFGGWTVGGGAEWAFSKIASLAVEYRHNDFGDESFHFASKRGPIFQDSTNLDLDSDQLTVKVNLLLGHMGPGH